jgi:hypothetical protein
VVIALAFPPAAQRQACMNAAGHRTLTPLACYMSNQQPLFCFSFLFSRTGCDDIGSYSVMSVAIVCDQGNIMYRDRGPSNPTRIRTPYLECLQCLGSRVSFFRGGHTFLHHSHPQNARTSRKNARKKRWWWCEMTYLVLDFIRTRPTGLQLAVLALEDIPVRARVAHAANPLDER